MSCFSILWHDQSAFVFSQYCTKQYLFQVQLWLIQTTLVFSTSFTQSFRYFPASLLTPNRSVAIGSFSLLACIFDLVLYLATVLLILSVIFYLRYVSACFNKGKRRYLNIIKYHIITITILSQYLKFLRFLLTMCLLLSTLLHPSTFSSLPFSDLDLWRPLISFIPMWHLLDKLWLMQLNFENKKNIKT